MVLGKPRIAMARDKTLNLSRPQGSGSLTRISMERVMDDKPVTGNCTIAGSVY